MLTSARNETARSALETSSKHYPVYVVAVLLLAYILSFMDRTVLSVLVDPIRADLGLSDTALSILIGFGFVLLYTTAGIALGRLADSGDRRLLITVGMTVWCLATAATSLATGFASLLIARVVVGIGEAALSPASYSLISSYFPKERLGIATSIYALGTVVGGGVATGVIGLIAHLSSSLPSWGFLAPQTQGWRTTFLLVGLFGLPFILLLLTVREPRKSEGIARTTAPSIHATLVHLGQHIRVYAGVMGGFSIMVITSFGSVLWGPSYFIRDHGFDPARVGVLFGLVMGVGGAAGVLSGGLLSDSLARRGILDAPLRVVIVSIILQTPLFGLAYLVADTHLAVALFAAAVSIMALQGGLQGAALQQLAPERMRGLTMAIYLMIANIVGMGAGPLIIALVTERVFGRPEAIGKSLAIVSVASSLISVLCITRTLSTFRETVRNTAVQTS